MFSWSEPNHVEICSFVTQSGVYLGRAAFAEALVLFESELWVWGDKGVSQT